MNISFTETAVPSAHANSTSRNARTSPTTTNTNGIDFTAGRKEIVAGSVLPIVYRVGMARARVAKMSIYARLQTPVAP